MSRGQGCKLNEANCQRQAYNYNRCEKCEVTWPRSEGSCSSASTPAILNFVPQKLEETSASLASSGRILANSDEGEIPLFQEIPSEVTCLASPSFLLRPLLSRSSQSRIFSILAPYHLVATMRTFSLMRHPKSAHFVSLSALNLEGHGLE